MERARPDLVPDPGMDRAAMVDQQEQIRAAASFEGGFDPGAAPLAELRIAGVDQAFTDDRVVSTAVVMEDEEVVDVSTASRPIEIPYIPGLLSFREARAVLAACEGLSVEPDILLVDGNGRLHFREAGIATHVGVVLDAPTVGVAKRLLCGYLCDPPPEPFPVGTRVPIRAGGRVEAPSGTLLGYAVQTKQWDRPNQSINPVYVSPGHRVDADAAATVALETARGYKLPEPIRQADRRAGEAARADRPDR